MEGRQICVLALCCILSVFASRGAFPCCSLDHMNCSMLFMFDIKCEHAGFANCADNTDSVNTSAGSAPSKSRLHNHNDVNISLCQCEDYDSEEHRSFYVQVCRCGNCIVQIKTTGFYKHKDWLQKANNRSDFVRVVKSPNNVLCSQQILAKNLPSFCHDQKLAVSRVIVCRTETWHLDPRCLRMFKQQVSCKKYSRVVPLLCGLNGLTKQNAIPAIMFLNVLQVSPFVKPKQKSSRLQLTSSGVTALSTSVVGLSSLNSSDHVSLNHLPCSTCTHRGIIRNKRSSLVCPAGFYGPTCEKECHCRNNKSCDVTGVCQSQICATGWSGPSCSVRMCPNDTYGVLEDHACDQECICSNSPCNIVTGECPKGSCEEGSLNVECIEQQCFRLFIQSLQCSAKCSCTRAFLCHPITGYCPMASCAELFEPPNCVHKKSILNDTRSIKIFISGLILALIKVAFIVIFRVMPKVKRVFMRRHT